MEAIKGKLQISSKKKILLSQFQDEYLEWCEKNRSPATYKKAESCLKKLSEITGDIYLYSITRKHLDDYVNYHLSRGLSKVTINIHIRTIKSAFSKAVEWGYIEENPFKGYKQLKVQEKPPKFLLPEQIALVESVINDNTWKFIFRLLVYTGMRIGELLNLKWSDIDFKRNLIVVRRSKNFKTRVIPIHPELRKELLKHYKVKQSEKVVLFSKSYIEHKLKKFFREANFPDLRIHDLRHTFASLLVMSGVELRTIQELLGHTSYRTTEIYAHLAPQHLYKAIEKFPSPCTKESKIGNIFSQG